MCCRRVSAERRAVMSCACRIRPRHRDRAVGKGAGVDRNPHLLARRVVDAQLDRRGVAVAARSGVRRSASAAASSACTMVPNSRPTRSCSCRPTSASIDALACSTWPFTDTSAMPIDALEKALWKRCSLTPSSDRWRAVCSASRSAASRRTRCAASSNSRWRKYKCSITSSIAMIGTAAGQHAHAHLLEGEEQQPGDQRAGGVGDADPAEAPSACSSASARCA